jgi:hypothetical protein
MGMLMVRCPKTGQAVFTGLHIESSLFSSTPVFFSSTYCPHCRVKHEWFVVSAVPSQTIMLDFVNPAGAGRRGRLSPTPEGRSAHWIKVKIQTRQRSHARPRRMGGADAGANLRSDHHRHTWLFHRWHSGGNHSFRV